MTSVREIVGEWDAEDSTTPRRSTTPLRPGEHARTVKGIKSSTLGDYAASLRYPDHEPKHRGLKPVSRVMRTFGGRRLTATTADVSRWLVALDRDPALSARSANKHRLLRRSG